MVEPERAFMDEKDVEWRQGTGCLGFFSLFWKTEWPNRQVWWTSRLYGCEPLLSQGGSQDITLCSLRIFENCSKFSSRFVS